MAAHKKKAWSSNWMFENRKYSRSFKNNEIIYIESRSLSELQPIYAELSKHAKLEK